MISKKIVKMFFFCSVNQYTQRHYMFYCIPALLHITKHNQHNVVNVFIDVLAFLFSTF